ncbi:MAG: EAL domain-containing protein [Sulfuritalea sp.]|nr:EAL domain-containing protein [Sulfuritalea sp.]
MTHVKPSPARDANEEIAALIKTLHSTGQRLEQLTAGEVDGVADHEGRTFLLRPAQEHLRDSEAARQAAILDALPTHVALLDSRSCIVSVNQAWRQFAEANGLQGPQAAIGINYLEVCDRARGEDVATARQVAEGIRAVLTGEADSFSLEYPCHAPTQKRWFLMTVTPLAEDASHGVVVMHLDLTEQVLAEIRIKRLNRVYAVLSGIDALIVRVHDRDELFRETCRIAVEAGAFRTAWIGVIDPQTLDGRIVAWHGADQDFVSSIKLTACGSAAQDEPPACRSLRQGQAVICNDITKEPSLAPRLDVLMQRGYRSMGCFPLTLGGRSEAVIALFAGEQDYFDAEEVRLLVNLAANLSFALDSLEHEKTLKITEAQRLQGEESLRRFSSAMDATRDEIYLVDRTSMRFIHVNDAACRVQGKTREELLALGPEDLLARSRADLERTYDEVIASGADAEPVELLRQRKDGAQAWIELRRHAQRSGERWTIITLVRDITERKKATKALRESEARFRSLTALSSDWYWQQDEALRFVAFSGGEGVDGWLSDQRSWVGLRRWEIPGITPLRNDWNEHQALLLAHQPFRNFEYQRQDADGSLRYVVAAGEPIFDDSGGFTGYRGVATDITERKAAELKIRRLNRVHAVLSGINTLIVREQNRDALFREACRIAVEEGGFRLTWIGLVDRSTNELVPVAAAGTTLDASTLVNQRFSLLDPAPRGNTLSARAIRDMTPVFANDVPNDPAVVFKEEHAKRGSRSMAILPLVVSGEAVGMLALYAQELDFFDEEELKLLTELAGDIAFAIDHIGKEAKLNYLAYYDPLTGLANRSLFLDRMAQHQRNALAGRHQLAVFLIDLERFKNINDSLGRPAGDALLRQVAEWLTSHVKDASLLARVGADHFVVVLPKVEPDCDVEHDLEITMTALAEHPFRLNDSIFRITARVGVALFPDDGADAETLFRNAEAALKLAKVSGERYLFYTRTMTTTSAAKLSLENQLRQALDNGEFVLHYQPKVSLASGKMSSAEALIRWNDPRTGLVPPGRFIPILEETGLIYEVGRWALRQAIADYLRWHAAGLPAVRIAVNVSPLQLRNRGFIDEIEHAISIDPQAAAGLELEITESLIMEDVKHSIASLQAIRTMGISIAIDDFGTGFSSLSYLARLPVDTLKIDRSFVIDMTVAPEGLALVSTIISLAHSLKLKVVAEGVETEEQSRLLRLLDCDEMQGFLFSKPLPAETFEARYLTRSAAAAT